MLVCAYADLTRYMSDLDQCAVVMSSSRASACVPIAFEICPVFFPVVGKANLVETVVVHGCSLVFGAHR